MTGRPEVVWSRPIGPKVPSQPTTRTMAPIMLAFPKGNIALAGRIRNTFLSTTILGCGKSLIAKLEERWFG